MKLPILDLGLTEYRQIQKIKEEATEVHMAYVMDESIERRIEESIDAIQANITYMHQIATDEQIDIAWAKHEQKMKERGYKVKGYFEVTRT